MKLSETELLKHENLQLRRQNVALVIQKIEQEEIHLGAAVGQRLNVDIRNYELKPNGELVFKPQLQSLPEPEVTAVPN